MAITATPPAENVDPWFATQNAFDTQVKSTANGAETAAAAAQSTANAAVPAAAVAGLNTIGWGRVVFIAKGGTIPGGTLPYTLVIEAAV